ncbi:hypothetical protein [Mycoplasma todarodis]|uniref:Lipoprotein n=1 Tax=Mycoplasma todarodis TaxID=1937191 RepID=A0A4R0XTW7_9MOLU|nr:hypothetical protein [Mycoplasma todarodis]TCG11967.1 hypothetical protein C4B25_00485 [Mycoplasma todarodis]
MKKMKKIVMGTLGACAVIATPIATVISCGSSDKSEYVTSKTLNEFSTVINKASVEKDGWGQKGKEYRIDKKGENGERNYILTDKFVDYLVERLNHSHLTEEYKVVHLDLRYFGLDGLGDYFWSKLKDVEVNKTEYNFKEEKMYGSSGIILNVMHNPFVDKINRWNLEESEKIRRDIQQIKALKVFIHKKDDSRSERSTNHLIYFFTEEQGRKSDKVWTLGSKLAKTIFE